MLNKGCSASKCEDKVWNLSFSCKILSLICRYLAIRSACLDPSWSMFAIICMNSLNCNRNGRISSRASLICLHTLSLVSFSFLANITCKSSSLTPAGIIESIPVVFTAVVSVLPCLIEEVLVTVSVVLFKISLGAIPKILRKVLVLYIILYYIILY